MQYISDSSVIQIEGPVESVSEDSVRFVCTVSRETPEGMVAHDFVAVSETAGGAQILAEQWIKKNVPNVVVYDRSNPAHKAARQAVATKLDEKVSISLNDKPCDEDFWEIFRSRYRGIYRKLAFGPVSITRRKWSEIQSIPGFSRGPAYGQQARFVTNESE